MSGEAILSAKIVENLCMVGAAPRIPLGSSQRSSRPSNWWGGGLLPPRTPIPNPNNFFSEDFKLVSEIQSRQRLRSASSTDVVVPATRRSSLGDRAFPVAGARAWNALPASVTAASSLSSFRRLLKTFLFQRQRR